MRCSLLQVNLLPALKKSDSESSQIIVLPSRDDSTPSTFVSKLLEAEKDWAPFLNLTHVNFVRKDEEEGMGEKVWDFLVVAQ